MSDGSAMEIDQTQPSGAGQASSSQQSFPFNPLTFNYLDIPRSTRIAWCQDPPIEVADGNEPKKHTATSAREYYRRMMTTVGDTYTQIQSATTLDGNPFRNDDRAGEEGFAIETVINRNVILCEIQANVSVDTTSFGISADRWPGLENREGIAIKASAAKHGIRFDTSYAVPMSRFGDGAVNNYKAVGVRKSLVDQLDDYDDLESPTVKQKQNLLFGAWEEDPEIDPDAEYPDVDKGIIYPNRILTLLGQEMSESDIEMGDAHEGDDDDDGDDKAE